MAGIFIIGNYKIDEVLLPKTLQVLSDHLAARFAYYITNKPYSHLYPLKNN
jgi:formyltetrahydrofolate hydrolase